MPPGGRIRSPVFPEINDGADPIAKPEPSTHTGHTRSNPGRSREFCLWHSDDAGILLSQRTWSGRAAALGTTRERACVPAGSDGREHARGMEHEEATRLAGLSRSAAYEWHNRYEVNGIEGCATGRSSLRHGLGYSAMMHRPPRIPRPIPCSFGSARRAPSPPGHKKCAGDLARFRLRRPCDRYRRPGCTKFRSMRGRGRPIFENYRGGGADRRSGRGFFPAMVAVLLSRPGASRTLIARLDGPNELFARTA
jgi:hypothetical protein